MSTELLESIEQYYNGTMPAEEKRFFEIKLEQDSSFRTQVEDVKALLLGIETQSLKEKMQDFHADLPNQLGTKVSVSKRRNKWFRYSAAVAAIMIGVGSYLFYNSFSNERLYNNYFKPDPGLPTTMSTTDNYDFYNAMVSYKHGDYKLAISKWEKLEAKKPVNDTLLYFLGVAHLADSEIDKALPYLEKASENSKSVFQQDANYYLGLALLKKDRKEEAILFLKKSSSESSKILLEKLK